MAVSVVNGFLCFSSCDVAKAMKGENPHPKQTHEFASKAESAASKFDQPAVTFGGSLSAQGNTNTPAVSSAQNSNPTLSSTQYVTTDVFA